MPPIDTTLRQWCKQCDKATLTRKCADPPWLCCAECCAPGNPQCLMDELEDWA